MFWTSFVYASMIDALALRLTTNDVVKEVKKRSDMWRDLTERLPIPEYMLDVVTVLATQFVLGRREVNFELTPSINEILMQSGDSDEDTRNSSSRPGNAFARAEHREPMCNHFYS